MTTTTAAQITGPAFERSRHQLLRHRLLLFTIGWCMTTAAWGAALMLQSRLEIFPATLLFTFQLGILIAAIAICHAKASPARVPFVVLAACVLLGLSSTGLFAAIGGYGDMLLFLLLTLYLASMPLFAWSGRAALVLIVGTLLPWVIALPFLNFVLRPADLAGAITLGAILCLATLRWSQRRFQRVLVETVASDARREVAESAAHVMFAVDAAERFIYANRTLASFVGIPAEAMVGHPFKKFFAPAGDETEGVDLAEAIAHVDGTRWLLTTLHGPRRFQIIAWVSQNPEGGGTATYALGREVPEDAEPSSPSAAAPTAREFAVLQDPLRMISDEEVHRLRDEVGRLRKEVLQQSGSAPGRPRRRPLSEPTPSASRGDTNPPKLRKPAARARVRRDSDDAASTRSHRR